MAETTPKTKRTSLTTYVVCVAIVIIAVHTRPCVGQGDSHITTTSSNGTDTITRLAERISVRLTRGKSTDSYIYGVLEVATDFNKTVWQSVCEDHFTRTEGLIACRMLGFGKAEVIAGGKIGVSKNDFYVNEFTCTGTERALADCTLTAYSDFEICDDETQSVALVCFRYAKDVLDVRLSDGISTPISMTGRLEVRIPPLPWGTVCDDMFNEAAAMSACQYMGYKFGEIAAREPRDPDMDIWLDEVYCESDQPFLECEHEIWGYHNCRPNEDIRIVCTNSTVRLLSAVSSDYHVGSVEVYKKNDGWYEVCDGGWSDVEAQVACSELGFVSGKALCCNSLGSSSFGSLVITGSAKDLSCRGTETELAECSWNPTPLCPMEDSIIQLAAVVCYDHPLDEVNMTMLVELNADSGISDAGTLRIRHYGIWGAVCDDSHFGGKLFTDSEASVACRSMNKGYIGGKRIYNDPDQADSQHVWLRDVNCLGNETSLDQCTFPPWGAPGLDVCLDYVRVICYKQELKLSFVTPNVTSGTLQITHDGNSGTICADPWTNEEARAACITMGFTDGKVWRSDIPETLSSPLVSSISCYMGSNFFMCHNDGWGTPTQTCLDSTERAGATCYNNIKLDPGSHGKGIVKFLSETDKFWYSFCREGFDNKDANVVCKELGFLGGLAMPKGAFGFHRSSERRSNVDCDGSETSIIDCSYSTELSECNSYDTYASVSCYNSLEEIPNDSTFLDERAYKDHSQASGLLIYHTQATDGYICANYFTEEDAHVACKEIGRTNGYNYIGGIPFTAVKTVEGPFFLGEPNCTGTEQFMRDCSHIERLCWERSAASVLCYESQAPEVEIEPGPMNMHSGRIQISIDGQQGVICANDWDETDASVACRQFDPTYKRGVVKNFPRGSLPFYLSDLDCWGTEANLFECQNSGWRNIPSAQCGSGDVEAGVICYTNVALIGGEMTRETSSGVLEVEVQRRKYDVCFDNNFSHAHAQKACSELGYPRAAILRSTDVVDEYYMMKNIRCQGDEISLSECRYTIGYCQPKFGRVRLLCHQESWKSLDQWSIKNQMNGRMSISVATSYVGYVCQDHWSDVDAEFVCHAFRFRGGKALGSLPVTSERKEIIWFGGLNCASDLRGTETCAFSKAPDRSCFKNNNAAGVLCYEDEEGIAFRLMDHDNVAKYSGRAEIRYNGVWGTVCNKNGGRLQARAFCRELGHEDGIVHTSSPFKLFGTGSGPIYLKDVRCSSSDSSFLGCPNAGWMDFLNCTHDNDLEVRCYAKERLAPDPEKSYGAVSILRDGAYKLVCSDQFTDSEAAVMCRGIGYVTGIAVCCSAFPVSNLEIGYNQVSCQGTEDTLSDCQIVRGSSCSSGTYASVACSSSFQNDAYSLTLSDRIFGKITLSRLNIQGFLCSEGFSSSIASVICKEKGYSSGLALSTVDRNGPNFVWPFNISCNGDENSLAQCTGFDLGVTQGNCADKSQLAYGVCLQENDDAYIDVRLRDGRGVPQRGRLEVKIRGEWGTVCGIQQHMITTESVNVVCRQLGYSGGRQVASGTYGPGPGIVWLTGIDCGPTATQIKDCKLVTERGTHPICDSHSYDTAIECFLGAKLGDDMSSAPNRGRLHVINKATKEWEHVCDSGITPVEATVVCKGLGYDYGIPQCCTTDDPPDEPISISSISCNGQETDISACTIQRSGTCPSNNKAYVHCSNDPFSNPNLRVTTLSDFIGVPKVSLYDIEGPVCATGLKDKEAKVLCKEMGYSGGRLLSPKSVTLENLIILSGLQCTGTEDKIQNCQYSSLNEQPGCPDQKAAQILCTRTINPITFSLEEDINSNSGRAMVKIDNINYYVAIFSMSSQDASVFCNSITGKSYAYGELVRRRLTGLLNGTVLMTSVNCDDDAQNFLDCNAVFLPKYSQVQAEDVAYIRCHIGAELQFGNSENSGILTLYNRMEGDFGTVCSDNFGKKEADVACRMLNYENGLTHCCGSFGFNYYGAKFKNVRCTGQEQSLFDCSHKAASGEYLCDRQDYVGLTCYNGTKDEDFEVSLKAAETHSHVGLVQIRYMEINGAICSDDWDDNDAHVVCTELGFTSGQAYFHYKPFFTLQESTGPIWMSNVQCGGNETQLSQCPHSEIGQVTECSHGHYAGVLCSYGTEVVYRLAGTDRSNYGRVEVRINGVWGTICNRFWDSKDANTMCKQLGYTSGDVYSTQSLTTTGQGPVYEIAPRCTGLENNLNECPHEGWISGQTGRCSDHRRDAGVFCYSSVRLSTGSGRSADNGPVLIFKNDEWFKVCDDGFDDMSARKVCQELGYYSGLSICCSAYYGESTSQEDLHPNITLKCRGDETSIQDCVRYETCHSGFYASVICLDSNDFDLYNESDYTITLDEDFEGAGKLAVSHMGVKGRICSTNWTDDDAKVFCRSQNFADGLAYYHSYDEDYVSAASIGPYWISGVDCDGTESSLTECNFKTREMLGDCTGAHTASVICFQNNGIDYRLSGSSGEQNRGRVELSVEGRWGTVCNLLWDDTDAGVVCRGLGYNDGEAQYDSPYGTGSGPIWLQSVQCTGKETALHKCPHTGFRQRDGRTSAFAFSPEPCNHHRNDAAVFCYRDVKLNQGLRFSSGALLYYNDEAWTNVCDESINRTEAQVACRGLMEGYQDGLPIRGGRFARGSETIGINSISCSGLERSLSECSVSTAGSCASGQHASVACFQDTLTTQDFNFQLRLSNDSIQTSSNHGILEIRENGIWGRICMHGFTDTEATVACKQMNFNGGVTYLHLFRNRNPLLWTHVQCQGTESSLLNCEINRNVDRDNCAFDSSEAGVVCYRNEGVQYRLSGTDSGRVEIGLDGNFGSVCSLSWNAANSKTLCRSLGYIDGIPMITNDLSLPALSPLFSFFLCAGNESSLLSCLNSGFDDGQTSFLCGGDAFSSCYNEEIKITSIRISGGEANEGRVEVFASGMDTWGTICDDDWDDNDATVVCKVLGFTGGVAIFADDVPSGTGNILLDDVQCKGTEEHLSECSHVGINSHNCEHDEDAGVRCFNVLSTLQPPPSPSSAKPPSTPRTTQTPATSSSMRTSSNPTTRKPSPTTTQKPSTTTTLKVSPPTTTPKSSSRNPPSSTTTTRSSTASSTSTSTTTTPRSTTHKSSTAASSTGMSTSGSEVGGQAGKSKSKGEDNTVVVAAAVTIVVAIVLIVIIIFVIYRFRVRLFSKSNVAHERFHNDSIEPTHDGSVAMQNQMYDLSNPSDDPMTRYMADNSEIHLDRSGCASFSKGAPETNEAEGFSNPLYSAVSETATAAPSDMSFALSAEDIRESQS